MVSVNAKRTAAMVVVRGSCGSLQGRYLDRVYVEVVSWGATSSQAALIPIQPSQSRFPPPLGVSRHALALGSIAFEIIEGEGDGCSRLEVLVKAH